MGKLAIIFLTLALLLAGCGSEETFETVADEILQPALAQSREIILKLPEEAASPAVESGSERLYQCRDYDISVQVLEGGDLGQTIRALSGYDPESLTVLQTQRNDFDCCEFVWASLGETGELIGRGLILSDGTWHYCVSILADANHARDNQVYWDEMFRSVTLS